MSSTASRLLTGGGLGAASVLTAVVVPQMAEAAIVPPQAAWDEIARCESGNRNVLTTGGSSAAGYYQITTGTWRAHGGAEFAPTALGASRAQQTIVANRIYAARGSFADWNASKSCWGAKVAAIMAGAEEVSSPAPTPTTVTPPAHVDGADYIVKRGDTLTSVAAARSMTWQALYALNRDRVSDPNRIYVGQALRLSGGSVVVDAPTTPITGTYTVKRGDTLVKIANATGLSWHDLYNANRDKIGGNAELIYPGMVLTLTGRAVPQIAVGAPVVAAHAASYVAPLHSMHITQAFKGAAHQGIDLHAPLNTPGYAVANVTIAQAGQASGFGLWVVATAQIDGQRVDFVYGHMNRLMVHAGERVNAGDQIINTGNGGGVPPHLHFEVWIGGRYSGHPVDPAAWLRAHGVNV